MSDEQVSYYNLNAIRSQVDTLSSNLVIVNNNILSLHESNKKIKEEVEFLQVELKKLIEEQRYQVAYQGAVTEVVRVKKEVAEKFGAHKQIRDNMISILSATDLSLIKENALATCTEGLMTSAPSYWLAPCLVALAAWICNNESLAKKAVKEAMKRDREKACLLFALICRRNGRVATCLEWLNEYFKLQTVAKMRESTYLVIDAYLNGVFGEDKDNVCGEHLTRWLQELKTANPNLDSEQVEYWKDYFASQIEPLEKKSQKFISLHQICDETDYKKIDKFIRRIRSVDGEFGMKKEIYDIVNASVDKNQIVAELDNQLKKLVTEYEKAEAKLKKEEERLELIKECNGNYKKADAVILVKDERRLDNKVDFVQKLKDAVSDLKAPASQRKTAVIFLQDYIKNAFKEYIEENKALYPEEINLSVDAKSSNGTQLSWKGKTKEGENEKAILGEIEAMFDTNKNAERAEANRWTAKEIMLSILTNGIGFLVIFSKKRKKVASIDENYDSMKKLEIEKVKSGIYARKEANVIVDEFLSQEDWNSIDY